MVGFNSLLMGYDNGKYSVITSTSQAFFSFCGNLINTQSNAAGVSSEADVQVTFRSAGTMTNLSCRVKTAATSTSTVVLRINSANGNETFSITANTTGAFSDNSDQDSLSGGQKVCVGVTAGSTALLLSIIAATFSMTLAGESAVRAGSTLQTSTINENSETWTMTPLGMSAYNQSDPLFTPTDSALTKNRQRKALTIKNLCVNVVQNGNGNSTFISVKNGSAASLTISISGTGVFEDTTHSDSVAVGDDYNWQYTDGTSSGSFLWPMIAVADWISTNGDCILSCACDNTLGGINGLSTAVTTYAGLAGDIELADTTEMNTQVTVNTAYLFSQLTTLIRTNSITATSTINLRANTANPVSGPTLSITASTTGIFNDNTDTYQSASSDKMNYQVMTGSTGTHLLIQFISVWGNAATTPGAEGPSYYHFDNSITNTGRQLYNSFSDQMQVFG